VCSACSLQHLDYGAQLAYKQQRLLEVFRAQGGIVPESVLEPLTAGPWGYRRRARLSVRDVPAKGRVLVGFRERDGRFVTDMRECHTLAPELAALLPALSSVLGTLDARASIPQLEAACGDGAIALVVRHLEPLGAGDRERLLAFEEAEGVQLYGQAAGPASVRPLAGGRGDLHYALPEFDLRMAFRPLDFVQVNGALNRLMVSRVLDLLAPRGRDRVLDLFCGLGNFTLPLARYASRVLGLEGDPELVARARDNAAANRVAGAAFEVADLYGRQPQAWPAGSFDLALLDPPRPGAGAVLEPLVKTGVRRIAYVSCNPETLAADARRLVDHYGFRLAAAGIMDMFPQTTHMEALALFQRT
jgi:23S rRNA (uracil1939-C5)-methyltransferase